MGDQVPIGRQALRLEGTWTLAEFAELCKTYEQIYNTLFLLNPSLQTAFDELQLERLEYIYRAFPWKGGYSAVNFYNSQAYLIPTPLRPAVRRISFESPGMMELGIVVVAAASVRRIVKSITASGSDVNGLYHDIYKGMHERRLMKIDAKRQELALARDQLEFADEAQERLAKAIGFNESSSIKELAGNPVAALKITLSLFRRARDLSEVEQKGRLDIDQPSDQ